MRSIVPHKATGYGGPEASASLAPRRGQPQWRGRSPLVRRGACAGRMARAAKALSQARRVVWYAPQAKGEAMELHVRMVACIALSAIGAQGEVAVNVVQWGSRVIVKGATELGLLVSLEIATTLLSVITRSHHNDITHTKGFHDLVFDTVNSLYLQLNLRMSEAHTCQLPTMTHPHRQRTVYGGGLHKLLPQPLLVVAGTEASARHL